MSRRVNTHIREHTVLFVIVIIYLRNYHSGKKKHLSKIYGAIFGGDDEQNNDYVIFHDPLRARTKISMHGSPKHNRICVDDDQSHAKNDATLVLHFLKCIAWKRYSLWILYLARLGWKPRRFLEGWVATVLEAHIGRECIVWPLRILGIVELDLIGSGEGIAWFWKHQLNE